jgi:hypothetical protein
MLGLCVLPACVFTVRSGDASAGVAALSMVPLISAATLPGNGVTDLFTNRVFLAGFWAWFTAQTLKVGQHTHSLLLWRRGLQQRRQLRQCSLRHAHAGMG